MPGLTDQGLTIRTQPEIQAVLEAQLAVALPGVNLRAGPIQQLVGVLSEEMAIAWEALQAVYAAAYPDSASGQSLDQVAAFTGTIRRQGTRSSVVATVNLNAGVTLPAGSIAAVAGKPDAQFRTLAAVTNSGGAPANFPVECEAVEVGPVAAPAGTLTVKVSAVTGWNTVTNAADADVGLDVANDVELREQRVIDLGSLGNGYADAIAAAVAELEDVREVRVNQNVQLSTDGNGLPGKSFEVVAWDGSPPAADDDEIAQAIWDNKPAGIFSFGNASESGVAIDKSGREQTIAFSRATQLSCYVSVQVVLAPGVNAVPTAQAKTAILERFEDYRVGDTVYASQLICALLEVPGILAVPTCLVDDVSTPVTTFVTPTVRQIVAIANSATDITLTEAP
jgi:uncharacterized phage protein gp47/JayE